MNNYNYKILAGCSVAKRGVALLCCVTRPHEVRYKSRVRIAAHMAHRAGEGEGGLLNNKHK